MFSMFELVMKLHHPSKTSHKHNYFDPELIVVVMTWTGFLSMISSSNKSQCRWKLLFFEDFKSNPWLYVFCGFKIHF